jgi:hypothetical protein
VKNWPRINQSLSQSGHMAMYAKLPIHDV